MFLLVSSRHVGAHPDGHQHGVSIQISIHFWKNISGPREGDTRVSLSCACLSCAHYFQAPATQAKHFSGYLVYERLLRLDLGEGLCIFTSFRFPDSGLYLLNGFAFYFDGF